MRPNRDLVAVLALFLPALLLVLPGSLGLLGGDPYPHLSGAGWVALAALPAGVLLLAGPGRPASRAFVALLLLAGLAAAQLFLRDLADPLEARRAVLVWLVAGTGFGAGSALGANGRRLFSQGLVLTTLVLSLGAIVLGLVGSASGFAGSLGNSGATSQVALPGAVLGAWFAAARRGPFGWLGGAAALAFVVHICLAPVVAGSLAFALGLGALLLSPAVRARAGRVRALALFVALPFLGLLLARALAPEAEATGTASAIELVAEEDSAPSDLDGAGVRLRLWWSLTRALGDRSLLGFGPGQFQAQYPPLRDPREIELSRHGVCLGGLSEVEHAHQELAQVCAELGRPAGFLFAVLLAWFALVALRQLRADGEGTRGLAAATLAVLLASLAHSTWSFLPLSAWLSFTLFGALVGPRPEARLGRVSARVFALALFLATPAALGLARHGLGFRRVLTAVERDDERARHAELTPVLDVTPDSFPARIALARTTTLPDDVAPWLALLGMRPFSVELEERLGHAWLRAGDPLEAAAAWDRALALSPTHPRLLRNRIRLGWEQEDAERGDAYFERLLATGCLDDDWIRTRGVDCLLRGRVETGLGVLARLDPDTNLRVPERLYERATDATDLGATRTGEALRAAAHFLWGREHAAAGSFRDATRSYRQALAASVAGAGVEATPIALELSCAEWRADRAEDARRHSAGLAVDARTLRDLPDWAREAWAELERAD